MRTETHKINCQKKSPKIFHDRCSWRSSAIRLIITSNNHFSSSSDFYIKHILSVLEVCSVVCRCVLFGRFTWIKNHMRVKMTEVRLFVFCSFNIGTVRTCPLIGPNAALWHVSRQTSQCTYEMNTCMHISLSLFLLFYPAAACRHVACVLCYIRDQWTRVVLSCLLLVSHRVRIKGEIESNVH